MVDRSRFDLNAPKWTNRLLGLVLIVSVLMIILTQSSHLWDRYRVVPDVQNSYWMARYQDSTLFPVDYLFKHRLLIDVEVMGLHLILYPLSLGYGLLFYLASFVIDHIWLSKWLIFVLMPICIIYLFKLGYFLEGNLSAASLSLFFIFFILASGQSISLASGLQRAFAVPLLLIFLYYIVREQYLRASLLITLSALFYWPNFPLAVLTYGLSLIKFGPRFKVSLDLGLSKLVPFMGSLLVSMLLLIWGMTIQPTVFRPATVPISQNPLYQAGGVAPMFISFPWFGRAGIFNSGRDVISFIVLLILGVIVYIVVGRQSFQRLPGVYWQLLAAAIIMYVASFFFIFVLSSTALYQPSRYTRVTLFLLALCFVGLNWGYFLEKAPNWFRRKAPLLIFFVVSLIIAFGIVYLFMPSRQLAVLFLWFVGLIFSGVLVAFGASGGYWLLKQPKSLRKISRLATLLVIVLVTILAGSFYIKTLGVELLNPSKAERDIYEFVNTLPKDVILAGDPVIMSGIPLFSQRSVLFRDLFPNVNPNVSIFIQDFFDAQYAEGAETVLEFCQRYKIGYLVIDSTEFTPDYLAKEELFYRPYNDKIVKTVAGRSNFVLLKSQPAFTSGPYRVIKCDADTVSVNN